MHVRYGTIDEQYLEQLGTTPPDEDGPIWMVNLIRHRDRADYADGRETELSGREADEQYAPLESLAAVGAEVVFVADVQDQLLGAAPQWDQVAVVRYPTRRAFVEMGQRPEYQEAHAHKDAGVAETIVIATTPFTSPPVPDDAPGWDAVPHPPTPEDGYVQVLHVLRYEDEGVGDDVGDGGGTPGEMDEYTKHATGVALANGVRLGGWFRAEGTIVGDGRTWHQVRFNTFPSREAFMAVVFDPDRLKAQGEHREAAIADTYTMVLRPIIDRLNDPDLVAFALEQARG